MVLLSRSNRYACKSIRAFCICFLVLVVFKLSAPLVFQYLISYSKLIINMANDDKERFDRAEEITWEMEYRLHEMDMLFYNKKCDMEKHTEPYAWLTAMLNDNFAIGAVLLGHMLRKLSCYKKMIVLVSNDVSMESRDALRKVGYEVRSVEALDCNWMDEQKGITKRNLGLPGTHMRFHAWNFTEYKKIIYVDGDVLPIVSIDDLFHIDAQLAASYCARPGLIDPCFNAGILLFKTSTKDYEGIMNMWKELSKGKYCPNDQVLLWHYYADNGLWKPIPYAYNVRRYLYHPMKVYHFACCLTKKPWRVKQRPSKEEIKVFRGPLKDPQDMIILWWKYFDEALDLYHLHVWYDKVKMNI